MSKIKVDKIVLRVGKKKEIELSLEETKELQKVLTDLLGVENNKVIITSPPVTIPYPYPIPSRKRYEWWDVNSFWVGDGPLDGTITICSNESSSGSISLGESSSGTYVT